MLEAERIINIPAQFQYIVNEIPIEIEDDWLQFQLSIFAQFL